MRHPNSRHHHLDYDWPWIQTVIDALYGGRWNRPGTEALYLSSPRETCAVEFCRMAEGQGRGPASYLPRTLHTISVDNLGIIDLTTVGVLESIGLQRSDLEADDWTACQQIGDAHNDELDLTSSIEVDEVRYVVIGHIRSRSHAVERCRIRRSRQNISGRPSSSNT